jgi:hypothetical protein
MVRRSGGERPERLALSLLSEGLVVPAFPPGLEKVFCMPAPRKLTKAEAGRMGARAKWGPQRLIRLDGLAPEYRAVVLTFIEAAKATEARNQSERAA